MVPGYGYTVSGYGIWYQGRVYDTRVWLNGTRVACILRRAVAIHHTGMIWYGTVYGTGMAWFRTDVVCDPRP